MKNFLIAVVVSLAVIGSIFLLVYVSWNSPVVNSVEQLQQAVAERDATIERLQTAVNVYYNNGPPDKIDTAAKAGLTEMPGWQFQKILEHGGDGSIFLQLSASTKQYASVISTVGPLGYSWQSTTDDALKAAEDRRGKKSK